MKLKSKALDATDKTSRGAVAQLGERVVRNDEVVGSIPICSTNPSAERLQKISNQSRFPENLPDGWKKLLKSEASEPYFQKLIQFLNSEYSSKKSIFPPREFILRAIQSLDYADTKVVLLGQDPYHGDGQAIGLCFGVPNSVFPKPPSLKNVFKEISSDLGIKMGPELSDLTGWLAQGVLLLNTVLTVRKSEPLSHREKGWETFTDKIIRHLNDRKDPVIFILWGASAHKKKELITNPNHFILQAPHPSPFSADRGFFGCKHFSKTNEILRGLGKSEIQWELTSKDSA